MLRVTHAHSSIVLLIAVSVCRLICGLAVVKVLSVILGPSQFGTLSQVIGVCALFYSFAGGGVTNGVILFAGGEPVNEVRRIWLTAALTFATVAGLALAAVASILFALGAEAILGDARLAPVFLAIAGVQAVIGIGNVLLAYCSGRGDVKTFAIANIVGTLAWAALIVAATALLGFSGATWAVVVTPVCSTLVIVWMMRRRVQPVWPLLQKIDRSQVMTLLQASGYMALAICALPIAQAIIRADLAIRESWHSVGLWQSIARLSDAYMQIFGVLAVNFLLPRLLQCKDGQTRNVEVLRTGGVMLALYLTGASALYLLREPVVGLAYSPAFLPATVYLLPQLAADFAKIAAWILVYRFIAVGKLWVQPAAEIFQGLSVVLFYFALWPSLGSHAPVVGHLLSCIGLLVALGVAAWWVRV
jgi:O-antigen/teichoic acid export membrane protein